MAAHTEIHGKYKIEIEIDTDASSPRDWDNLGKMVCFHKRYDLGDKHEYSFHNYFSWDMMKMDMIKKEDIAVILPLYMYDHSGITIATTPFGCRFDSGQIGWIYATKEDVRKAYSCKMVTSKVKAKVNTCLLNEVEVYDQYVRGEVYGFKITDTETDEEIDSCWGIIGNIEYVTEEAKSSIPKENLVV